MKPICDFPLFTKGNYMKKNTLIIKKIVYSAMFIAVAMLLPSITMHIKEIGKALCPMHLPVILCGFVCGPVCGAAVGFVSPLLRMFIFHMPLPVDAITMAFELLAYGLFSGVFYKIFPKKIPFVYVSLIISMILGRFVWGGVKFIMAGINSTEFGFAAFWAGAVANAVPGIILQIVLVPIIFIALKHAKLTLND